MGPKRLEIETNCGLQSVARVGYKVRQNGLQSPTGLTMCDEITKYDGKALHKKCPYSKSFWSVFSRIWTVYGEIWSISSYSVQMQGNPDQNNSEYGHFLHSEDSLEKLIQRCSTEQLLIKALQNFKEKSCKIEFLSLLNQRF